MLTERGVDGVAVGETLSLRAVVDRHKKVISAVLVVGENEVDMELDAFAELYESLPQLTIDTTEMHGLFVGERALVDGRMAFQAAAAQRRAAEQEARAVAARYKKDGSPPLSMRASKAKARTPTAVDGGVKPEETKYDKQQAFALARQPSSELLEALEAKGLESMGSDLGLAGIKSITALMM